MEPTTQTPTNKIDRVYNALSDGGSYHRFEAERLLFDHCLPSTISSIQKQKKVSIARKWETVPGYQGNPARVCRYWITAEERARIQGKAQEKALTSTRQNISKGLSNDIA